MVSTVRLDTIMRSTEWETRVFRAKGGDSPLSFDATDTGMEDCTERYTSEEMAVRGHSRVCEEMRRRQSKERTAG